MEMKDLKRIGQGNTAEVYAVEEDKILKLFRKGIPKALVLQEYQTASFLQNELDNVPKAYSFCEVENRYGIVYEKINGTDMVARLLHSLWKVDEFSRMLAGLHGAIHQHRISTEEIPTVKNKLLHDIQYVKELSGEQKAMLTQYMKKLPDGNALCHFDFHPGNVLMQGERLVIIDWMTACYGDSGADVARTYLLLRYGEMPNVPFLVQKVIKSLQKHILKSYLSAYQKETGIKWEDIEKWILPVAAARLQEWITERERRILLSIIEEKMRAELAL